MASTYLPPSGKGTQKATSPIKTERELELLKNAPFKYGNTTKHRDHCLIIWMLQLGIRSVDIVEIKLSDVIGIPIDGEFTIREKKTKKNKICVMNVAMWDALDAYLQSGERKSPRKSGVFLFPSMRGNKLDPNSVSVIIKDYTELAGIGHYTAHSLRKTRAYHLHFIKGFPLTMVMKMLNHSNPEVTMRYLGELSEEMKEVNRMVI
jgi:integrase